MTPRKRPTEWTSVVMTIAALLAAFGFDLSEEQIAAVAAFVGIVVVPAVTWIVSKTRGES